MYPEAFEMLSEIVFSKIVEICQTAVVALALKNPKEVGGGDFDVIFQSKGIPN